MVGMMKKKLHSPKTELVDVPGCTATRSLFGRHKMPVFKGQEPTKYGCKICAALEDIVDDKNCRAMDRRTISDIPLR